MRRQYRTPDDLPASLAVFPLAGAILLPRATLPLNIFEPRYLAMIDDAMRGDRLIGMIQPTGEGGVTGSPQSRKAELARVGCTGRLTSYQETEDGRLLIVLTGVSRFEVREELPTTTPYRMLRVDFAPFADDLVADKGADDVDREKLVGALRKFLAARGATADWGQIEKTGTEQLVNWLSLASPFAPKEKQALLEAVTLAARADVLVSLAEMEAAGGAGGGTRLQ